MGKFDRYAFSAQPDYDEAKTREAFAKAVPLKTVVIHCYDPRAADIPAALARLFGDETWPGVVVTDAEGARVASTATIFPIVVAGGRATDALRSITIAQHLFGIRNVVVVHHSHCGGTSFTADGIIDAHAAEHHRDISDAYPRESICITDFEESLRYDAALIRGHPGTPPHVDIYGFFYDIDTGHLEEVVVDRAPPTLTASP